MAALYIVDSNFFIQAHRMHYPMDVFPNFWQGIKQLASEGIITSIDKVRDEIFSGRDVLAAWCRDELPMEFFRPTSELIQSYLLVTQWANSRSSHYQPSALAEFLHADEADAWLVAFCLSNRNVSLVTHEVSDPMAKKRIKIPDACQPFSIRCVNTIEMFRELGRTF